MIQARDKLIQDSQFSPQSAPSCVKYTYASSYPYILGCGTEAGAVTILETVDTRATGGARHALSVIAPGIAGTEGKDLCGPQRLYIELVGFFTRWLTPHTQMAVRLNLQDGKLAWLSPALLLSWASSSL